MASRKIYTHKGFTLLEVLIVLSLVIIIGGFGLIVSMDNYRGFNFRAERDVVVSVLQKARSQAINNMCFGSGCTNGKPHGVYFGTPGTYVIFQGASYAARDTAQDEVIVAKDAAAAASGATSVVFATLSGEAATTPANTAVTVVDGAGNTSVITIDASGRVWWTH